MQPKLVVITGPTASGKTALGVMLAQRLGGEVVSADSMQIYRGMDIGTAKPTPEEMQGVPHHMIDIADPTENYSVSRYAAEATACVDDILARGKLPIVVGGTGLYIDSLIAGRTFADGTADTALRQELNERYDEIGGEGLLGELRKFDPERAAKLHPADKKRIVRAMEVYILTGKTITQHDAETRAVPPRYDAAKIALTFADRQDLYARIDRRVDAMMQQGLLGEVRALLPVSRPTARPCRPSAIRRPWPPCAARRRRRRLRTPSGSPRGSTQSASSRGCGAMRSYFGCGTKKRRTWTWPAAVRRNSWPGAV